MPGIEPAKKDLEIIQRHPLLIAEGWQTEDLQGNTSLLDTSGYAATLTVRQRDWDGPVVLTADEGDYIALGFTPSPWETDTAYMLGHYAIPTSRNGFIYIVTDDGTSDNSTEPTWPTTINATVADGTVEWTCISTDSWLMNCFVNVPSSVTALLEDWGAGVWSLELIDPFGNVQQMLKGSAWLQRSAT